jgi:hypothetical protein
VMKDDLLTREEKQTEIRRMNEIVQETVLRFRKAYENNEWFDYNKEMDGIIKDMKLDKKEGSEKIKAEKNTYSPYWMQLRTKEEKVYDLLREFGGLRDIEQTRSYSREGEKIELAPEDNRAFNELLLSNFAEELRYGIGTDRDSWDNLYKTTNIKDPTKTELDDRLDYYWNQALTRTKSTFTPTQNK